VYDLKDFITGEQLESIENFIELSLKKINK
jgi:hypothetical protein